MRDGRGRPEWIQHYQNSPSLCLYSTRLILRMLGVKANNNVNNVVCGFVSMYVFKRK